MSDDGNAWVGIIAAAGALFTGALSSIVTLLISRRPAKVTAEAAWQSAMNAGFEKLTAQYDARNRELSDQVNRLEQTVRAFAQHVESLETLLRNAGVIDLPPRPVAAEWPPKDFQIVKGGRE